MKVVYKTRFINLLIIIALSILVLHHLSALANHEGEDWGEGPRGRGLEEDYEEGEEIEEMKEREGDEEHQGIGEYERGGDEDEDDEYEEDEYEEDEVVEEAAKGLGSLAFVMGLTLNSAFLFINRVRRLGLMKINARHLLNFHITSNMFLALLAFLHSYLLANEARVLEMVLLALIIFLLLSGLTMRYGLQAKGRILSRFLHVQLSVSLILVALLLLHVGIVE